MRLNWSKLSHRSFCQPQKSIEAVRSTQSCIMCMPHDVMQTSNNSVYVCKSM